MTLEIDFNFIWKHSATSICNSFAGSQVFPNELEAQREFEGFTEWLQTFELYRGKQTEEEFEDDGRVVGKFKGSLKIYKLPLPKDLDDHTVMGFDPQYGFFQVMHLMCH